VRATVLDECPACSAQGAAFVVLENIMSKRISRRGFQSGLAALALVAAWPAVHAKDADEARRIVERARISFGELVKHKDHASLRTGLKSAKGVLIFPSLVKGGFVVGATGGTGVLLVRGEGNGWSDPAFYTLGGLSVGLQAGGEASQVVILVTSQKGVDRLLTSSLKLGADASVAAGPVGQGRGTEVTSDFVSYTLSKGAFAGLSIEGSVLDVRDTLNGAYYGKAVTPVDILVKRSVRNPHAESLRGTLAAQAR
jgi:lipid-binding SYLF domain-containing protein